VKAPFSQAEATSDARIRLAARSSSCFARRSASCASTAQPAQPALPADFLCPCAILNERGQPCGL
jgi:hypothetical protein